MYKLIFLSLLLSQVVSAQINPDTSDLVLEDPEDMQLLLDEIPDDKKFKKPVMSEEDQLEALKEDLGDLEFTVPEDDTSLVKKVEDVDIGSKKKDKKSKKSKIKIVDEKSMDNSLVFDVGAEEKKLLSIAQKMQGKIPENEWNEIAATAAQSSYTVVKGEWLWKISKRIFGSGFYYAKIWSLNPYITNPHEIEPGMVLNFTTGNNDDLPQVRVGSFDGKSKKDKNSKVLDKDEYDKWGDDVKPDWISEKEKLRKQGVFVQYSTGDTDEDLKEASKQGLIREYEYYEPPRPPFEVLIPQDEYDETGFDRSSIIDFKFKEGYFLNTFVSTNIVQDFGEIESAINEKAFFSNHDNIYVRFDEKMDVVTGDKYSVYTAGGEVEHKNSDREGFKYTIVGAIEALQKHDGLWECKIVETSGVIQRNDRITIYTPKIERITRTFNTRLIESTIIGAYSKGKRLLSFGDVVYLDRGRADGVEMGNVFEIYGFKDRATGKDITGNPVYKNGELTVITLTDNFATALVTQNTRDFYVGNIAVTKTKEAAARATKLKMQRKNGDYSRIKDEALDELDVELNLDDINDNLLDKADKIQFTEDELAELERQEREKSIMSEGERDLRSLERLEKEIETAEAMLNEARLDEDKLLEGNSLDEIEKNLSYQQQESLDELEENFGKQFLDEELNDKDNPYGLTEFDIEEIDELLNIDKELESKMSTEGEKLK